MMRGASPCIGVSMPTNKKTISVRLDPKLAKRLEDLARKSERSVSWHVNRIISDTIDSVEAEVAAVLQGVEDVRAGRMRDAKEVLQQLRSQRTERAKRRVRKAG